MHLTPRTFGQALLEYRLASGLTQEELADRSGLSVRSIRDMERGRTARPYRRSVRLLADALHLSDADRSELLDLSRGQRGNAGTGLAGPSQLPAGVTHFVGRERELQALDELLTQASLSPAGGTVVISAIAGTAGIGKTALALHWAHQASAKFPDGQLYINLHGFGPSNTPLTADEAVSAFLAALGVPPEGWPPGLEARAGLYRSLIAGRRLLIVLDNARDAAQVHPLLPGSPGCLALVTSRAPLGGLAVNEDAHLLALDVLSEGEARQLLAGRLGAGRVSAEPGAVNELIQLSARLPLALAIVSARASARPSFLLAELAAELREESRRLDALDAGDPASSVRTVLSWSYEQLSVASARVFRLLGLAPSHAVTVNAAASLARVSPARARQLLDELARANLLTEQAPGRFGCHDLLHVYAIEQATAAVTRPARHAALGRLLDHYLHTAAIADRLLYPLRRRTDLSSPRPGVTPDDFTSHGQALAWLDAEHRGLVAAVNLAASNGFDQHAWQLAFNLETFFYRRSHWQDWASTQQTALAAARRLGDRYAQALAHRGIGDARSIGRLPSDAYSHLAEALQLHQEAGDSADEANVLLHTASAFDFQGRYPEALASSQRALRLARSLNAQDKWLLANVLNQVGWQLARLGRYRQALPYCEQSVALCLDTDNRHLMPAALDSLAYVYRHLGRPAEAADCYRRAVELFDELGDRYRKAETLGYAGDAYRAAGDLTAAQQAWAEALVILDNLNHPDAYAIRAKLALVPEARREPPEPPSLLHGVKLITITSESPE